MRRLLVVVLAALFLVVGASAAAAGEAQPNDSGGTLVYSGGVGTYTFECADGVCVDTSGAVPVLTFRDGISAETVTGTFASDGCTYRVTSTRDLVMTAVGITGTSTIDEYVAECPEGTTTDGGITTTFDLALESGDPCLIDASCASAAVEPDGAPGTEPAASAPGPGVASHTDDYAPGGERDVDTPTVLSALPTVVEVLRPANLAWAAGGTAVLGILVVIPSQFLNAAIDALVGRWRDRLRKGRMDPEKVSPALELRGWPWATGGVFAASVIAAFADPNFGFDAAGLRVFLTILVTFAIEVALGWLAVVLLVRRTHPDAVASFSFAPVSLLIVIGAVLLSRLSGFSPAIVFGLVAGVAFGGLVGTAAKARVTLIGLGWAFGLGLVAWVVFSFLPADLVIVREFLAAAAIAGISALPIALLPVRGITGHTVWEWRKPVWLIAYGIGLFAFLLVLLPLPGSYSEVGVGLWTWIALFVGYAVVSIGIWLVVSRPCKGETAEEPAQA